MSAVGMAGQPQLRALDSRADAVESEAGLVRRVAVAEFRCHEVARVLPVRDPRLERELLGLQVHDVQPLRGARLRHVRYGQHAWMEAMFFRREASRLECRTVERALQTDLVVQRNLTGRGDYVSRRHMGISGHLRHRPEHGQCEQEDWHP